MLDAGCWMLDKQINYQIFSSKTIMNTKIRLNFGKKILIQDQRAIYLITHKKSIRLIMFSLFLVILLYFLKVKYNLPILDIPLFGISLPLICFLIQELFYWIKWRKEIKKMILASISIKESFVYLQNDMITIENYYSNNSITETNYRWKELVKVIKYKNTLFLFPKNKYKIILRISKEETNPSFFSAFIKELSSKIAINHETPNPFKK